MIAGQKYKTIIFVILLSVVSVTVIGSFITYRIDGYKRAMFEDMIEGRAYKPFVYRCLVPIIIRNTSNLIPANSAEKINEWGRENIPILTANGNNIRFIHYAAALIIWFLSVIGFAFALMKLAEKFYSLNRNSLYIIALISVAGLPVFFKYYGYVYDFTDLFLFTLCLYFLADEKWILYSFFLAVATINKETSVLLILVYFLYYKNKLTKSFFYKLLLLQITLFVVIKGIIDLSFINNPGSIVEFHIEHNLGLEPFSLAQFAALLALGILIFKDWKYKPAFLKTSSLVLIPLIALTFFFGYLDEYRDYYEIYPILVLLIAYTIFKFLNFKGFSEGRGSLNYKT